jgi:hypothetical protein
MIVAAIMEYPDVLEEVLIASAFLNGRTPFVLPQGFEMEARKAHHSFRHKLGDFVSYLKIFRAYEKSGDPEGFCERSYLDPKGMREIYNVKEQLAQIASEMGVPITGGGDLGRYLITVSKGLVQFVCKRAGRSNYSSLTAYGIKIHPGSVMFKQRPDYLVAGEIMRTSQMYAMSVSPLYPQWLKQISPDLHRAFIEKKKPALKKVPTTRDFTNFIKIGSETFPIEFGKKKKKMAVIPMEKLGRAVSTMDKRQLAGYKGLRGKVLLDGYELMSGTSLKRILEVAPKVVGQASTVLKKWPRSAHFEYVRDAHQIVRYIPSLLTPCVKAKSKTKLGFLTLLNDGEGTYWFSGYQDFVQALEESVSSLENLVDEDVNVLSKQQEKTVNETYRRLTETLED